MSVSGAFRESVHLGHTVDCSDKRLKKFKDEQIDLIAKQILYIYPIDSHFTLIRSKRLAGRIRFYADLFFDVLGSLRENLPLTDVPRFKELCSLYSAYGRVRVEDLERMLVKEAVLCMDLIYSFPRHFAADARPANGCLADPEGVDLETLAVAISTGDGCQKPGFARFFYKRIAYFDKLEDGPLERVPVTYALAVARWTREGGNVSQLFKQRVRDLPYAFLYPINMYGDQQSELDFSDYLNEAMVQSFSDATGCKFPPSVQEAIKALMSTDETFRNDIAFFCGFPQMLDTPNYLCSTGARDLLDCVRTLRVLLKRFQISDLCQGRVFLWIQAASPSHRTRARNIASPPGSTPALDVAIMNLPHLKGSLIPDDTFDEIALLLLIQVAQWPEGSHFDALHQLLSLCDWRYHTFEFHELFKVIRSNRVVEISPEWVFRVNGVLQELGAIGRSEHFLRVLRSPMDEGTLQRALGMFQELHLAPYTTDEVLQLLLHFENTIKYVDAYPLEFSHLDPETQAGLLLEPQPAFTTNLEDGELFGLIRQRVSALEKRFAFSPHGVFRLLVYCTSESKAGNLDGLVSMMHAVEEFVGVPTETDALVELATTGADPSHFMAFVEIHRAQQATLWDFYFSADPGTPFPDKVAVALIEANGELLLSISKNIVSRDAMYLLAFSAYIQSGVCLDEASVIANRAGMEPNPASAYTFEAFGRSRDRDSRRVVSGWRTEGDRMVFDLAQINTETFHTCCCAVKLPFMPEDVGAEHADAVFPFLKKTVGFELATMCMEGKPLIPEGLQSFDGAIEHWVSQLQFHSGRGVVELSAGRPIVLSPRQGSFSIFPMQDSHFTFIDNCEISGTTSLDLDQEIASSLTEFEDLKIELGVFMFERTQMIPFTISWHRSEGGATWKVEAGEMAIALEFPESMVASPESRTRCLNWMTTWVKALLYNHSHHVSPLHPSAHPHRRPT